MTNEQGPQAPKPAAPQSKRSIGYWLPAAAMCLFAATYTFCVVRGIIPKDQRIDATNLIILALAVFWLILLVNPEALARLRHLKVGGFELDLEKIKQKQEQQQGQLEAISLLLPLVLREEEAKHLRNLGERKTAGYIGNHDIRTELRRLRTMGLIESRAGLHIGAMKSEMKVDLAEYVGLTPFGERMVTQLVRIEEAKADQAL